MFDRVFRVKKGGRCFLSKIKEVKISRKNLALGTLALLLSCLLSFDSVSCINHTRNFKNKLKFGSDTQIIDASLISRSNKQICAAVWAFVDALNDNSGDVGKALLSIGSSFGGLAANPTFRATVALIAEGESVLAVIACLSTWEIFLIGGGITGLA